MFRLMLINKILQYIKVTEYCQCCVNFFHNLKNKTNKQATTQQTTFNPFIHTVMYSYCCHVNRYFRETIIHVYLLLQMRMVIFDVRAIYFCVQCNMFIVYILLCNSHSDNKLVFINSIYIFSGIYFEVYIW